MWSLVVVSLSNGIIGFRKNGGIVHSNISACSSSERHWNHCPMTLEDSRRTSGRVWKALTDYLLERRVGDRYPWETVWDGQMTWLVDLRESL
ncbi:hypothetical protein PISMIDRAFT_339051 [Pisolithus microcarpus 441]|uniref:Uncharacterized protein n=1 Tax=Pisolithus microcarpus 441 TaxID=765257 RepID=A0A0C9ZHR2_9AGAM|nr:hypothetical protein PISMIDRAFT_339051 [Pisolithus microcarpus 441]